MDQTALILNRVLPVFFLIGLGYAIRQRQFLTASTIAELRKIVVNLALPAVLFLSFVGITFRASYLVIFVTLFGLCLLLLALGYGAQRRLRPQQVYFPFLMTGFEYGMLGVSLFGSAYGLESIGYIAVMDLGHELFIWFVFLALLLRQRDGLQNTRQLAGAFVRSPVILAILAGIGVNLLGLREPLLTLPVTGALMSTLQFLSGLTIPLILLIVGYDIRFDRQEIRGAALVVGLRLALLLPLALLLNVVLIRGLLGLEAPFEAALFTLLILPPPFIIPLYMRADAAAERRAVNTTLTLYTAVSLAIFVVYFVFNPTL